MTKLPRMIWIDRCLTGRFTACGASWLSLRSRTWSEVSGTTWSIRRFLTSERRAKSYGLDFSVIFFPSCFFLSSTWETLERKNPPPQCTSLGTWTKSQSLTQTIASIRSQIRAPWCNSQWWGQKVQHQTDSPTKWSRSRGQISPHTCR